MRAGAGCVKHTLKRLAREVYARVLWHTGLARLVSRLGPKRLLVLYGHCVADEAVNGDLAPEMKLSEARLEHLLRVLGARFDLVTIGEGMRRLRSGAAARSMVALSMDDGYRDNLTRLVPLLARVGGAATVFLEAGPVVTRRVGWLHTFEWLAGRLGAEALRDRLLTLTAPDPSGSEHVRGAAGSDALKRALKYRLRPDVRDGALATLAHEERCDLGALVDRLYLDAQGARALVASGCVEPGGHTVAHPVLATLPRAAQAHEVAEGRALVEGALGGGARLATFAYPYGRRWDFDDSSVEAAREAGFEFAVTTHAGVNTAASDPFRLRRWPIEEGTPVHLLGVEASGGFEWLRRLGLDLVE